MRKEGQDAVEQLHQSLVVYEEALQDKYFGGSEPAMVDYMLWPWFERIPSLTETGFVLNGDGKQPKLAAWLKAMQTNEAVQKTKVPDEIQKKFYATVKQGKTDYDAE
jgi:pyrimidodiazepine synthase